MSYGILSSGRQFLDLGSVCKIGDNRIQNFHFGRYIVQYTVGNLVLWRRASGAVKRDFRTFIRRYKCIPHQRKKMNMASHSNALLQSRLKLERCKLHKYARNPTKCDVINDVKLFPTVYRRINCRNFLTYPIKRHVTKASALIEINVCR